eukprot:TRINITY_DN5734_c0_g1_i1.p1 TRINITY_DN5734_c0_g1~~TRINITY_DN5734_c0_g1_i1.p1  ORF type:complete len:623 (+),score=162.68 TRINITY_DN5734_c0_g1_i1:629-2497(+)
MRLLLVLLVAVGAQGAWPVSDAPFWPKYPTRRLQVLDGQWAFGFAENVVIENVDPSDESLTPNSTSVPSVFDNAMPGIEGRRGTAFYRTTINAFAEGSQGMIAFAACGFYCKVWLGGDLLGEHKNGGYSMFWFDIPKSTEARELFVLADNRFNTSTAPIYTGGDFWHFAGITRSVIVHEIPATPISLQRVEITPLTLYGDLHMRFVLTDFSSTPSNPCFKLDWGQGPVDSVCVSINGNSGAANVSMPCKSTSSCKPWSFDEPHLYEVNVTIGTDTIWARFGLRVVGTHRIQVNEPPVTEVTRLTLNGEVVKLKGYNHHTMYPDTGLAVTLSEHKADMGYLKELGANVVRGAHYPQDQRWLDLCDENGIGMWVEGLGPGVSAANIQDTDFMKHQQLQMEEMVHASFNNPSVLMWGFFNEGPSNDQKSCDDGYKVMADTIKAMDTSRLVTWADDKKNESKCLPYADLVSFNSYPAWYGSGGPETCAPFWDGMAKWVATNFDKPFMISETGAAGVYEWANNASSVKWGQAYQTAVIQADAEFAMNSSLVSSLTLWQFMDIKANDQDTVSCGQCDYLPGVTPPTCGYINVSCNRPGGENHKGTLDFWRRKKQVFTTVQKIYHGPTN